MLFGFLAGGQHSPLKASHRCMLEMSSVQGMQVQAELYDEDEKLLCNSGPVVLLGGDDDWVCLKTTTASDGGLYKCLGHACRVIELQKMCSTSALCCCLQGVCLRLKSCIRDCDNGWTLCFDVKDSPKVRNPKQCRRAHVSQIPLRRSVRTARPS